MHDSLAEKRAQIARLQAEVAAEETRIAEETREALESQGPWDALAAAGAQEAEVEYAGSGDEGEIERVGVYSARNPDVGITVPAVLSEALEEFVLGALEKQGIDWYNNDGGYGTCTFRVADRVAEFDHHQRYEATTDSTFEVS